MFKAQSIQYALPFVVAVSMALTWTHLTQAMYDYNVGFAKLLGLSIFPLIGWTVALTLGYLIMERLLKKLAIKHSIAQFVFMIVVYSIVVVVVETVGYYVIGIQNIGTSQYAGLPLCNCLHAPAWMQAGYFLLGPIHWVIVRGVRTFSPLISGRFAK